MLGRAFDMIVGSRNESHLADTAPGIRVALRRHCKCERVHPTHEGFNTLNLFKEQKGGMFKAKGGRQRTVIFHAGWLEDNF